MRWPTKKRDADLELRADLEEEEQRERGVLDV